MPQHPGGIQAVLAGHKCQGNKTVESQVEATLTDIQVLFRERGQLCQRVAETGQEGTPRRPTEAWTQNI